MKTAELITGRVGFASVSSVISLESSVPYLNQSDTKLKAGASESLTFSRGYGSLRLFSIILSSSHWYRDAFLLSGRTSLLLYF